jgi:cytidine deaminase
MKRFNINVQFLEYESLDELVADDRELLERAISAIDSAYAPYSQYFVGAAVRLANGSIITGNNQENVAYPSGLCAERVALFSASSNYPGIPVTAIAIAGKALNFPILQPVTPCGACRQVIAEYENLYGKPVRMIMKGEKSKIWITEGITSLLPLMFNAEELKKHL